VKELSMQLCKIILSPGDIRAATLVDGQVRPLQQGATLSDVLHADDPRAAVARLVDVSARPVPVHEAGLAAPIDQQEVWAAGVTYKRSQEARERESVGAAKFYDLVYSAQRPELFFKAPAYRVRGPGQTIRVRADSRWSVPEPELALVISPRLKLVGFTIGNDVSARDIEGDNPLYLPQAKFYDQSCSLGPVITLAGDLPALPQVTIRLAIERGGKQVFEGTTTLDRMKRSFDELIAWLGKETTFPHGAVLLTGTGVVPPDDFTLMKEDTVHIDVTAIGRLTNPVDMSR
jgi:2-dehydro-3-deoxy-D-arabinonate dehydratase